MNQTTLTFEQVQASGLLTVPPMEFKNRFLHQAILNGEGVKLSEYSLRCNDGLKFSDLEKNFVIDTDVDLDQKILDIAAKYIFVLPNITARAKEMKLRAKEGVYNFGTMNYEFMEEWSPRGFSFRQGEFEPAVFDENNEMIKSGKGSKSIKHLWPMN